MNNIERLEGLDKHLYELVAPLVMNPKVLKQNRNYPFRTAENFLWFVATQDEDVIGFLPVEIRHGQAIINNYYTKDENQDVLSELLSNAIHELEKKYLLISIAQNQHLETFSKQGFATERKWKNYVRMKKSE